VRKKATAEENWANTVATAVRRRRNSAGAAPAVSRSARNVLKRTNGESVTGLPGFVLIVNVSA
jgi:hypothetical protein